MKPKNIEEIIEELSEQITVCSHGFFASDETRKWLKQALKSYALWLIEEAAPEVRQYDPESFDPHDILTEGFMNGVMDYKQNLKKLIE